jgi:hypothetical protein
MDLKEITQYSGTSLPKAVVVAVEVPAAVA